MCICVGCGWAGGGFAGAAASSAPAGGGDVRSASVVAAVVSSGGGVGRFLVDMVKVEEDVNPSFVMEARVTDRSTALISISPSTCDHGGLR